MESRFFKKYTLEKRDIDGMVALTELPDTILGKIHEWFLKGELGFRITTQAIRSICGEDSDEQLIKSVAYAVSATREMLRCLGDLGETSETFLQALKQKEIIKDIDDIKWQKLNKYFSKLDQVAREVYVSGVTHVTESRSSPILLGSNATINIRPVFERHFDQEKNSIKDYSPQAAAFTVVGLLEILIDDGQGEPESKSFQVTPDALEKFITDLLVLQKELNYADQLIPLLPASEES